jgi:hypothetical protein
MARAPFQVPETVIHWAMSSNASQGFGGVQLRFRPTVPGQPDAVNQSGHPIGWQVAGFFRDLIQSHRHREELALAGPKN